MRGNLRLRPSHAVLLCYLIGARSGIFDRSNTKNIGRASLDICLNHYLDFACLIEIVGGCRGYQRPVAELVEASHCKELVGSPLLLCFRLIFLFSGMDQSESPQKIDRNTSFAMGKALIIVSLNFHCPIRKLATSSSMASLSSLLFQYRMLVLCSFFSHVPLTI